MLKLYKDILLYHYVQNKLQLQDLEFLPLHTIQLLVNNLFLVRLLIDQIINQKLHRIFYGKHLKIRVKKEN